MVGGAMEIVHTAEVETAIGVLRIACTEQGLAYVGLPREGGRGFGGWLGRHAPGARCQEAWAPNKRAASQLQAFLAGKRRDFDLALDLRVTPFQREVLEQVARIGYGETRSYGEIARAIGRPAASRAVGAANGANPLPLVIPCHRVVESGGHLGGYGGGLALKRRLLAMERSGELL
jgi:O-6-methylguanine DNA methyltransferase